MLSADGVVGGEVGECVCELAEGAADAVVFCVVVWVLDCVAAADGGGTGGWSVVCFEVEGWGVVRRTGGWRPICR